MTSRLTSAGALRAVDASTAREVDDDERRLEEDVVALFDEYRQPLLRYLASLGLPFADGEEVIQEVFLSLFQHLRSGKPRHHLRGWLFRVAHNLGLKRRSRERRASEVFSVGTQDLATDLGPNPEEQMVSKHLQKRLTAVVDALPEEDRECLYLRAEGLRYREIAEVLEISLGSVALSLARSLGRISRAAER